MKGLIIKDLMCLRKQLTVFIFVLVGVLVISVMFVCSWRYGNLAVMSREMLADEQNGLTEIDIQNVATMALMLFMMLPLATVGDMANIFEDDSKAGFIKVASAMPVSLSKRVAAKFCTIFTMFAIGSLIDVVIAFILSSITDIIVFADFVGIIVSVASLLSVYSALVIVSCVILGAGKSEYARIISFILIVGAVICAIYSKIKRVIDNNVLSVFNQGIDFIKEKSYYLLLAAALVITVSFIISVFVADRKRGVV